MFVIEDELHAEHHGQFATFYDAICELKRRAAIPWDQEPNVAPCKSWQSCGRQYWILEVDDCQSPWKVLRRIAVLDVSASDVKWMGEFAGNS